LQQQIPEAATPRDMPFWKSMLKDNPNCPWDITLQYLIWEISGTLDDRWTQLGKLRDTFPILYTFAIDGSCTVASHNQRNTWTLQLHPQLCHTASIQLQELQTNPDFLRTLWRPVLISHRPMPTMRQDWWCTFCKDILEHERIVITKSSRFQHCFFSTLIKFFRMFDMDPPVSM
jgi:hypothetical protein